VILVVIIFTTKIVLVCFSGILIILYQSLNIMRKVLPLLLMLVPVFIMAQDSSKADQPKTFKNAIKVNLSSIAIRNYHIQYERQLAKKISFQLGFRIMPKGGLPLESTFEKLGGLDDPNLEIGKFEIGNMAITPEVRFYLSRKAMKGFYIAPYARYASFDLSLPFKYTYDQDPGPAVSNVTKTAIFTGKITSFSGGLMFGTTFNLGKRMLLDIWWIGGHYGSSNGDLSLAVALPTQQERDAIDATVKDFDPSPFKISSDPATANGKTIKSTGPWAGIRGAGINLGFRF
jgi:hypothetical protein